MEYWRQAFGQSFDATWIFFTGGIDSLIRTILAFGILLFITVKLRKRKGIQEQLQNGMLSALCFIAIAVAFFVCYLLFYYPAVRLPVLKSEVDRLRKSLESANEENKELSRALLTGKSAFDLEKWNPLSDGEIISWAEKLVPFKVGFYIVAYSDATSENFRDSLYKVFRSANWSEPQVMALGHVEGILIEGPEKEKAIPVIAELFRTVSKKVEVRIYRGRGKAFTIFVGKNADSILRH